MKRPARGHMHRMFHLESTRLRPGDRDFNLADHLMRQEIRKARRRNRMRRRHGATCDARRRAKAAYRRRKAERRTRKFRRRVACRRRLQDAA